MKKFNTELDKDLFRGNFCYEIKVFHKNGKLKRNLSYSSSFTIDEIYKDIHKQYKNKDIFINLEIES